MPTRYGSEAEIETFAYCLNSAILSSYEASCPLKKVDKAGSSMRQIGEFVSEREQKPNESITTYHYELQTLFEKFDPNFELEKFGKFFENEIRREYYQNDMLLLVENMN
ncbi:hypothetical protein JTB14_009840 [Gonioctena quinquepunctata]|nr:hypothetical protein JTB14_009840 [Gonioctena quinquepunctata]